MDRGDASPSPVVSVGAAAPPHAPVSGAPSAVAAVRRTAATPMRAFELVEKVLSYDPDADEGLINRAYVYSFKAHGSQRRASGDPYFTHPLEVAGILADYQLDAASIATGLLHDTVEDTVATLDEIRHAFGAEVADLVDGVTKLSQLELKDGSDKQSENFRKLLLAMSKDIRVLLVKLADRLHNMRTIEGIRKPEKRERIARETLEIYVPLAERIGIHDIKDELEDLCFGVLNPDARDSIVHRLDDLRRQGGDIIGQVVTSLRQVMLEGRVPAEITGREKRPFSIFRKLQRKEVEVEQLSDVIAFRVITRTVRDCYQALGLIHSRFHAVPGRLKDYISTPKTNGYQSIHTTVIGPSRRRVEIQIRTEAMHEIAERGLAAHWEYKQGGGAGTDKPQYRWLRELVDILKHSRPEEFLENTKLELFTDQVFCFSPKGQLISLPVGATPVDFGYAVHSEVGDRCVGAKVNGRLVPLRHVLQSGDQVEILTSKTSNPSPEWERFVVTGKARARVRRFIRLKKREEFRDLGRAMMQKVFRQEGYEFTDKAFESVLGQFKAQAVDDLYAAVGEGTVGARTVFNAVFPSHRPPPPAAQPGRDGTKVVPFTKPRTGKPKGKGQALPIAGLIPGMAVHFARCCHPIPGDRIVGIVTTGKGVTIHTIDCETLESFSDTPERWLDVSWEPGATEEAYSSRIHLIMLNEPGALGGVTTVIGKTGGNITNLRFTNRQRDFFELLIDVEVQDDRHLNNIMAALRATPSITEVKRARTG